MGLPPFIWGLLAAGLVGLLLMAYWPYVELMQRGRKMAAIAAGLGFTCALDDPTVWQEGFTQLPLFSRQPRGQIRNVMRGVRDGRQVLLFDYSHAMGFLGLLLSFLSRSGTSQMDTYMYTVAALPLKQRALPQFRMEPEGFFKRILGFFSDIDFPNYPEFSRRYYLRGSDPQAVRTLFQPHVLDALATKPSRLCLEGGGNCLLAYRPGGTAFVKAVPDEIRVFLTQALEVRQPFGE